MSLFSIPKGLKNQSLTRFKLRLLILFLFISMIVPVVIVTFTALSNLRSESLEQYQQLTVKWNYEIERKVNSALQQLSQNYHVLSEQPVFEEQKQVFPGLIGFFYIDFEGRFSSPLLPLDNQSRSTLNLSATELILRQNKVQTVYQILSKNHIVKNNPYNRDEMLFVGQESKVAASKQQVVQKQALPKKNSKPAKAVQPIREITEQSRDISRQFKVEILPTGHLMLHRTFVRQGQQMIEGVLIEQQVMFDDLVLSSYENSSLASFTHFSLAYQQRTLYENDKVEKLIPLANFQLAPPFEAIKLDINYDTLPDRGSELYIKLLSLFLICALVLGLGILYRMIVLQASLLKRQQGFISSISHELKTPITSIKMYGDSLQQGWLDDSKKGKYYQYITTEAERLSRLIDNMLHASNISRNALRLDLKPTQAITIKNLIVSKTKGLFQQSKFECHLKMDDVEQDKLVLVDIDALTQVIINLVDNAIKYSLNTESKQVDIVIKQSEQSELMIGIRDYGIGINDQELDKIFDLFYRVGDELTRTAKGTGLGLTLVKELLELMNGSICAVKHEKGAEFIITLPLCR